MSDRKVLDMRVAESQCKSPSHQRVPVPQVHDLLAKNRLSLCVIEGTASIREALQGMKECGTAAILVTDHERVVGIASEGDCARAVIDPQSTIASSVSDLMTPSHTSVCPADSLYHCLHVMERNNARYLPVLDGDQPVALISREQVLGELVLYLERVFHEHELDQQIVFLRGTYSC